MAIADVMTTRVVEAGPDETVRRATKLMCQAGVGAVAVCEGARLVGILTERDVLGLAARGVDLDRTLVRDVMTRRLVTAAPGDDVLGIARLMGERHVRHVPVVEGENLLGMIGIRDVLGALAEALWQSRDETVHETARSLLSARS